MLKTLTVWNFALLEQVEIDFDKGLNILTGETGAGKSILVDAMGAILGKRISSEMIRTGSDWLRVEAVFVFEKMSDELKELLESQAIELDDDMLIITRQLTSKGKGTILINGCHVTLSVLKLFSEYLIDIHGQNENIFLMKQENLFPILDNNDSESKQLKIKYDYAYKEFLTIKKELEEKTSYYSDIEQRADLLRWQEQEIENAALEIGEDSSIEQDIKRLANAEKISDSIEYAYSLFNGFNNTDGILSELSSAESKLVNISRYDDYFEESIEKIREAVFMLQEVSDNVSEYRNNLDADPALLDELQSRLVLIDKLKKKYGNSIEKILECLKRIQDDLFKIENHSFDLNQVQNKYDLLLKEATASASALSKARIKTAETLSAGIVKQLKGLGMKDAQFTIELFENDNLTAFGKDIINVFFSANLGEEPKSIDKVASGGELSRIALAIKVLSSEDMDHSESMIFDEIDAGIGGKTAQKVAESIASVSSRKQVICITHLPQIACMADNHLYIHKSSQKGKTITKVKALTDGERINEIARMASGINLTTAALDNAREMITLANIFKTKNKQVKTNEG